MTCKYCDVFLGTDGDGVASHHPEGVCPDCSTLRDKFAAAALTGMIGSKHWQDWWQKVIDATELGPDEAMANDAFDVAEFMMRVRKKKG